MFKPIIAAAACAALALAAGCGEGGDRATVAGDGGGSASATPPTTASPSAPGARNEPTPPCGTATLRATLSLTGAAAGNRYALLVLTNTGSAPCRTYGYPGLNLTGADAPPTKTVRKPETGKPERITLKPGASTWTRVHWGAAPGTGDHQSGDCQPTATSLQITPPDQRDHLRAKWTYGPVCERGTLYVSALHPGDHDPNA